MWHKGGGGIFTFEIRDSIDWYTAYEIFFLQEYSIGKLKRCQGIQAVYKKIIANQQTPLIVDCGGNIGLASKFFYIEYPKSKIISFEPNPCNAILARKNNANQVEVICAAVGPSDGLGSVLDPGLGANAYRVVDTSYGDTRDTKIHSINSLLDKHSEIPFLIKIDIEGFESELFDRNVDWIDKFPVLMIELHDWLLPKQATTRNFLIEISKRDRDFVQVGGNIFSISNILL